ncbi:MAG: hypothetical protein WAK86_18890 [Pseudonocardiaceae bacterium]
MQIVTDDMPYLVDSVGRRASPQQTFGAAPRASDRGQERRHRAGRGQGRLRSQAITGAYR